MARRNQGRRVTSQLDGPASGAPAGRAVPPATAAALADLLNGYAFRRVNERQLQDGIEVVLEAEGYEFGREVRLAPGDHIDFLVGPVGVEVKIDGPAGDVERQLTRYAASDRVEQLLLVTTKVLHANVQRIIGGVPVVVLILRGGI